MFNTLTNFLNLKTGAIRHGSELGICGKNKDHILGDTWLQLRSYQCTQQPLQSEIVGDDIIVYRSYYGKKQILNSYKVKK